jgi:hypothetical protein
MIRIPVSVEAFDATCATTLPPGSVGYENWANANGECLIWLEPTVVNRLRVMRKRGECFSDGIVRWATVRV